MDKRADKTNNGTIRKIERILSQMGLAASQARLLTITARLADNELRSQTINNAKMRLATQSAQASDEYVTALNDAQLMFTNTGADGLTKKMPLTFNALTQYSQYNNQYGIVNSAGQIMVSEEEAEIFGSCGNDLEKFLKAHKLEWETTFFDDDTLMSKLTSFYSTPDTSYIATALSQSYGGMSGSAALKARYLDSLSQDASIENMNYRLYAQKYYQEAVALYTNSIPEFRNDIMDKSNSNVTEDTIAKAFRNRWGGGANAGAVRKELKDGLINPGNAKNTGGTMGGSPAAYGYNYIKGYLNSYGQRDILNFINSFRDETYPGSSFPTAAWYSGEVPSTGPNNSTVDLTYYKKYTSKTTDPTTGAVTYTYPDGTTGTSEYKNMGDFAINQGQVFTCGPISIYIDAPYPSAYADSPTNSKPESFSTKSYIKVNAEEWYYNDIHHTGTEIVNLSLHTSTADLAKRVMDEYEKIKIKNNDGEEDFYQTFQITRDENDVKTYEPSLITIDIYQIARKEQYEEFVKNYLNMLLDCEGYFAPDQYASNNSGLPTLGSYKDAKDKFVAMYGFTPSSYDQLIDFEKLIRANNGAPSGASDGFNSVYNSWLVDKMLDVLGEPKYAWVDTTDPLNKGNADAKAQWLTNLFNRMQKGYKVLENGLAKSSQWLEHAFESGLVRMEQVDLSYNWVAMDYKSCSNIYEETDNSAAVSKAEAKYNRAMNDIKQKDSMFDLQLKNIDTEHTSLQTEYDVIKNVMNKNIERTMKFDQNG